MSVDAKAERKSRRLGPGSRGWLRDTLGPVLGPSSLFPGSSSAPR
jgi:hypothetical protein